jgi:hypothetical protein
VTSRRRARDATAGGCASSTASTATRGPRSPVRRSSSYADPGSVPSTYCCGDTRCRCSAPWSARTGSAQATTSNGRALSARPTSERASRACAGRRSQLPRCESAVRGSAQCRCSSTRNCRRRGRPATTQGRACETAGATEQPPASRSPNSTVAVHARRNSGGPCGAVVLARIAIVRAAPLRSLRFVHGDSRAQTQRCGVPRQGAANPTTPATVIDWARRSSAVSGWREPHLSALVDARKFGARVGIPPSSHGSGPRTSGAICARMNSVWLGLRRSAPA